MKRWIADREGALSVLLEEVFADAAALREGRVFVDRARVREDREITVGARVEVGAPTAHAEVPLSILFHDEQLIAVDKPAGLPSVPDHHGDDSLQARIAAYCKLPIERVHPTSRLDRGVSGVVLFALARAGRAASASAREHGEYARTYLAIAEHAPPEPEGTWRARIGRHPRDPRKRAVDGQRATDACTHYSVIARAPHGVMLALRPETGRTHQLRVHASHARCALDGDADYRGRRRFISARGEVVELERIALHAHRVELPHHARPLILQAPLPPPLCAWWQLLGSTEI